MDSNEIRLYLHTSLGIGWPDVPIYYMPSGNMELERPCIVYEPKRQEPAFANNLFYTVGIRYQVTFLSDLPGSFNIPLGSFGMMPGLNLLNNRTYVSDDIVHEVFTISINSIT